MARIRVPEAVRPSLERLAQLDPPTVQHLTEALHGAPPALYAQTLSDYVATQVSSVPEDELEDIIDTLVTLITVRSSLELTTGELVEDVARSPDLKLSDAQRSTFGTQLTGLLDSRALVITAKALDVLLAHERVLHDARILTDIRPVFLDEPEPKPVAAAVIHTLRLRYHANGETRAFTVAMTPADIEQIREQADRADAKAKALADILAAAHLADLENIGE